MKKKHSRIKILFMMNVVLQWGRTNNVYSGHWYHPFIGKNAKEINMIEKLFFRKIYFIVKKPTFIQLRKLLPYIRSKATLISFKSTSQRVTIKRINWLSFVPMPAMLLCKRLAKNSALFVVHCNIAIKPSSMSPLNSFLIAFSKLCPVICWYFSQI